MLKSGSINVSATSKVEEVDIAYFSASFSGEQIGSYMISKNIVNASAYAKNQSECDEDYMLFEAKAKEIAAKIKDLE